MATKLFLIPFPTKLLFPKPKSSPKLLKSLFSTKTQIKPQAFSQFPDPTTLLYGPSLDKGAAPTLNLQIHHDPDEESENGPDPIDKDCFTRVFELSALRVPSGECHSIEARIRGHLLNWPRIGNIARVEGDEVEEDTANILGESIEDDDMDVLNRRVYGRAEGDGEDLGPVLYREKLVRTFDAVGYVKFRNLARLSRPSQKRRKERADREGVVLKSRRWKNDIFVVEVVEDENENEDENGDFSGLLGDEFRGRRRWRGSTRLLLLDEEYRDRRLEDMPEAIKAVVREITGESGIPTIELVRCKLTLFYDYWSLNEILAGLLPKGTVIPSTFETIGHIAHLNLREELLPYKKLIAQVILDKNRAKIRTVVNKTDPIHNEYRTMDLEVLAGNHSLVTTVVENGLRFQVDFAKVYWNSRLATERQRLLNGFTRADVVCDVFSGVGPISVAAAKIVKCVYANDLNPLAIEYLERNTLVNKVEKKVKVFNMDGRRFIDAMFRSDQTRPITQVVMNLPNSAVEYLDVFRGIFSDRLKDKELVLPKIHVYGFSRASDPEFDFHERIRIALSEVAVDVEMRIVRDVAPGKPMLCASFVLPESVAFAKPVSST